MVYSNSTGHWSRTIEHISRKRITLTYNCVRWWSSRVNDFVFKQKKKSVLMSDKWPLINYTTFIGPYESFIDSRLGLARRVHRAREVTSWQGLCRDASKLFRIMPPYPYGVCYAVVPRSICNYFQKMKIAMWWKKKCKQFRHSLLITLR